MQFAAEDLGHQVIRHGEEILVRRTAPSGGWAAHEVSVAGFLRAYESEDLRLQVKRLADWLTEKGCVAWTDHPYIDRPPAPGWPGWMMNCVREADAVLVVPILPDGGDDADIPLPLRQWSTGHRFPSGRDGILRLVLAPSEVPSEGTHDRPRDDYTPPFAITSKHAAHEAETHAAIDEGHRAVQELLALRE
jgi:hypothetical protein